MFSIDAETPKFSLGERLRLIRVELFGENGIDELARLLNIESSAWQSYETRPERMPALVMLWFISVTGADPTWLLHGRGRRYRCNGRLEQAASDDGPRSGAFGSCS